ncbi:MAG TPA: hypothetical protein VLB27_03050 [candidate division Zixibacteria bacterium]|nr:hypothetical protein [candidate division Zixibacteria bacterium]
MPFTTKQTFSSNETQPGLDCIRDFGGVALQRFTRTASAAAHAAPARLTCGIALDIALLGEPSTQTRAAYEFIWPSFTRPFLIQNEKTLCDPGLDQRTIDDIIAEAAETRIEPTLNSLRVDPTRNNGCDTILCANRLTVGGQSVIIGVAFRDADDPELSCETILRQTCYQIRQDTLSLAQALTRARRRPTAPRALVDCATGEVVWQNFASNEFAAALAALRNSLAEDNAGDSQQLALVTFLRGDAEPAAHSDIGIIDYEVTDAVTRRLGRALSLELVAAPVASSGPTRASEITRRTLNAAAHTTDPASSAQPIAPTASAERGANDKDQTENTVPPKKKRRDPHSKTALRIALERLPRGARLKLSPPANGRDLRLESIAKNGETLVSIEVNDGQPGADDPRS